MSTATTLSVQDSVLQSLQHEGQLLDNRPTHFLVGFSGGMDSVVLLNVLSQLTQIYNLKLTAAFYEHRWSGFPAQEIPIIHQHCATLGVQLIIIPVDHTVAKTETAARLARYKAMAQLAQDIHATALLTAHHADDQTETILFRLFRGTGVDGLTGIRTKRVMHPDIGAPIPILRPMLALTRGAVKAYAQGQNPQNKELPYYRDPSNTDKVHQRNLIRHEVLPFLKNHFPNIEESLQRLSVVADGDLQIIKEKINDLWQELYDSDDESLDTFLLNQLSRPYQRRLIRRFLDLHALEGDFNRVEDIIHFIEGDNRHSTHSALMSLDVQKSDDTTNPIYPKSRFLFLYKNQLTVVDHRPPENLNHSESVMDPVLLRIPGITPLPQLDLQVVIDRIPKLERRHTVAAQAEPSDVDDDTEETEIPSKSDLLASLDEDSDDQPLKASLFDDEPEEKNPKPLLIQEDPAVSLLKPVNDTTVFVDLSRVIDQPLMVRTRESGDRIHPLGMDTPMRLKKFFINRGVSRFKRDEIPLLVCGKTILWAAGVGISEKLRVADNQRPTHRMTIEPLPPETTDAPPTHPEDTAE